MLKATATITREQDKELGAVIRVDVAWSGAPLDRPSTGGFLLKVGHMRLAQRLKAAVDAQVVYVGPKIAVDINGQTYVDARCLVMGKYLNADLRKLGY